MFWNSRLVRQSCKNCISIVEGDLQDTVEAPLGKFRDRGYTIEVTSDRMAGRPCKSIYVELDTAFGAAELFVESIKRGSLVQRKSHRKNQLIGAFSSEPPRLTRIAQKCIQTGQDYHAKKTSSWGLTSRVDKKISKCVASSRDGLKVTPKLVL
jgi:hypothetical protein